MQFPLVKFKSFFLKIHPEKKKTRIVKIPGNKLFIPEHDFKELKGKEIGLKELFNIKLSKTNSKAEYTDNKVKEIPHIQWISEDNIQAEILMPAGGSLKGIAEANTTSNTNNKANNSDNKASNNTNTNKLSEDEHCSRHEAIVSACNIWRTNCWNDIHQPCKAQDIWQ